MISLVGWFLAHPKIAIGLFALLFGAAIVAGIYRAGGDARQAEMEQRDNRAAEERRELDATIQGCVARGGRWDVTQTPSRCVMP